VHVAYEDERLLGVALDVDSEGALVLRLEDGTLRRFLFGDVSLEQEQERPKLRLKEERLRIKP
jgi:biotin-(acetyl-CoA carboxylase) ligase